MATRSGCLACAENGKRTKRGAGVRIVFDPGIQMPGTPTIEGHRISAEQVAGIVTYYGGLDNSEIKAYGITREEQIAACWWAGLWGPRRYRKLLGAWAEQAGRHLWYRCINVPNIRAALAAAPGDAIAESVERTRPLVDAERASQRVSGDLMEFRMGDADA